MFVDTNKKRCGRVNQILQKVLAISFKKQTETPSDQNIGNNDMKTLKMEGKIVCLQSVEEHTYTPLPPLHFSRGPNKVGVNIAKKEKVENVSMC